MLLRVKDSPQGRTRPFTKMRRGEGGIEFTAVPLFINSKYGSLTKQRVLPNAMKHSDWFTVLCYFQSNESYFVNALFANQCSILQTYYGFFFWSNCVSETIEVTEGRMQPAGHMLVRPDGTRGTEKKNAQQKERW